MEEEGGMETEITKGRNVGYNEETRKTDLGDRDEDATMDVRSDTQIQDQE